MQPYFLQWQPDHDAEVAIACDGVVIILTAGKQHKVQHWTKMKIE